MKNIQMMFLLLCLSVFAGCSGSSAGNDSLEAVLPGGSYQDDCANCRIEKNCLVCGWCIVGFGTRTPPPLCKFTGCKDIINRGAELSCI